MDQYQKFINDKAENKRKLMGKMFFPRTPVLLFDLSNNKKPAEYKDLLSGLDAISLVTLVIMPSKTDAQTKNTLIKDTPTKGASTKMPEGKFIKYIDSENVANAQRAADFILILNNEEVPTVLRTGCVPISQQNGDSTVNYNPLQEKGNGFYFKNPTKWELFAAIVRALETYQFPYDWENLIRGIIKIDN